MNSGAGLASWAAVRGSSMSRRQDSRSASDSVGKENTCAMASKPACSLASALPGWSQLASAVSSLCEGCRGLVGPFLKQTLSSSQPCSRSDRCSASQLIAEVPQLAASRSVAPAWRAA